MYQLGEGIIINHKSPEGFIIKIESVADISISNNKLIFNTCCKIFNVSNEPILFVNCGINHSTISEFIKSAERYYDRELSLENKKGIRIAEKLIEGMINQVSKILVM